jgi:hypothetical protein
MTRPFGHRRPPELEQRLRAAIAEIGQALVLSPFEDNRSAKVDAALTDALGALDEAWQHGREVGRTERPPAYLFTDVELPWRVIRRGDAIVGDDDLIYTVVRSGWNGRPAVPGVPASWGLTLASGSYREQFEDDPDTRAPVIVRVGLADAVRLTREALGAQMITTRRNADGTYDGDLMWRAEAAQS